MPQTEVPPTRLFCLSGVAARLRDVLLPVSAKKFWVRAQFVPVRNPAPGGHFYGQLIKASDVGQDIARIRGQIWKSNFERIEEMFQAREQDRPDALRTGVEVCAQCSVRYHPFFGLSLAVFDIDSELGEAQVDRKRRLILEG